MILLPFFLSICWASLTQCRPLVVLLVVFIPFPISDPVFYVMMVLVYKILVGVVVNLRARKYADITCCTVTPN